MGKAPINASYKGDDEKMFTLSLQLSFFPTYIYHSYIYASMFIYLSMYLCISLCLSTLYFKMLVAIIS